jgi:hypothetical protein
VVPSVTLGTGVLSSPVRGALGPDNIGDETLAGCAGKYAPAFPVGKPVGLRRAAAIAAKPRPMFENPGMKRLQPQNTPAGNLSMIAIAATMKPRPMKTFIIPFSMLGSTPRFLSRRLCLREEMSSCAGAAGKFPESACATKLMFAPQTRQKLAPSRF